MYSYTLFSFLVILLSFVIVDIICGDVTNVRQAAVAPRNGSVIKSTTPWPSLGQTPNRRMVNRRPTQGTAPKWIQQNNIWIKNEQAQAASAQSQISGTEKNSNNNGAAANGAIISNPKQQRLSQNNPDSGTTAKSNSANNFPATPATPEGSRRGFVKNSPTPVVGGQTLPNVSPSGPGTEVDAPDEVVEKPTSGDSAVTDDELREFSETLLKKDLNNAAKYVVANFQGMTSSRSERDEALQPLLVVDPAAYKIPSVEKMALLFNNYFLDAGQNEVYTGQERIEENNLLDTVLATPVMQFARSFLIQKGKIGKDPREFKDLLRLIWFNMYSRGGGRIGSSGFEHVFLAELKNNMVSGLHNWLYFSEEEKENRANYLGYMKKIDLGNKGSILKYHFTFHGVDKPVGSMFIGTSPELEMALYSTCFLLRADKICPLKMNGNRFIIRTYSYRYRGKNMIGSAFPEI
ncbi:endoribonuclease CG2145-like isoform X2 [Cylas formicarius]|uniref:endoribonuclease CG2145-like isoform X2 n=1 Tax=Cylas formicarius TaxID=197179 RepID=UPI0029585760|nr:endoribonuclease CG2145-like isoform X2 [Cylas formicarius]